MRPKSSQWKHEVSAVERIKDSVYTPHIAKLIASGNAYYCFETDEELAEERNATEAMGIPYKYSGKFKYTLMKWLKS